MPRFSDQAIEEIRARTDIVELISQRVPLRRAGADFKACCPFHHEKTPSFVVSPSRRAFHCFGCGEGGDAFKFLMLSDGMTFPEAVKALADRCGVALEDEDDPLAARRRTLVKLHNDIADFFQRCLAGIKEAAPARAYLQRRQLDGEIAGRFRLGYAPARRNALVQWAGKHGYDPRDLVESGFLSPPRPGRPGDEYYNKFQGRLMFPICDQGGRVVAFSGRILEDGRHAPKYYNSPETPIFRKSRTLYGLCFAKRNITRAARREALVCEGQIDVIRCHAYGFGNAVASQGTAFTEEHVALLKAYADSALLVFDGDDAGLKAASRTGRLFLAAGMPVRVATLPPGEDPDSILRDGGAEAFKKILDAPVSLAAFQIAALRAKEADPSAIDAVARITGELFETFAACSKAVLRSCLIQESAELLGLPLAALEADFAAYLAAGERRRQWQERLQGGDGADKAGRPPAAEKGAADAPPPGKGAEGATPPAAKPRARRFPETALLSIAEFLVKTSTTPTDENRALAEFVGRWLPEAALGDGPEKTVVVSALADWRDGRDRLATLASSGSDDERALIDYLSRRRSPAFACDLPLPSILQDFVARAWIESLRRTRSATSPETEEGQTRRLQLSSAIRRLESDTSWEGRARILAPLLQKMVE